MCSHFFTLSFIFSLPLYFPFSLNLEFVGLGCGQDAMLGVVGLQWFFMDRGSLRWFVVGLCGGFSWIMGLLVIHGGSLWWFGEWVLRFDISEL